MHKIIVLFPVFFMSIACSSTQENESIPRHIKKLEHLTVYPTDTEPDLDIRLVREQSFGYSGDVLIGNIGNIAVDESGRVFIADWDKKTVLVFNPDGGYLKSLGRKGRGPGEFQFLIPLRVIKNQLYVVDGFYQRCNIFSLDTLAFSHAISLHPENQDDFEELTRLDPTQYFIKTDGTFLVSFQPMLIQFPHRARYNLDDKSKRSKHYHPMGPGGILSDEVLEQNGRQILTTTIKGEFEWAFNFQFTDKPLLGISDDDRLFSARREEFLIKVYAPDGEYLYSFYYPYERVGLTREDALKSTDNKHSKNIIQHAELPETWPALNSLLMDDQNHLWVSTVIDDQELYQWWVLKETGELIARFTWPRNRQIEIVKNGKLYARETDEETGLQQIVRYRIEMK